MQITSLEQYHSEYKKSVENPESFWDNIAYEFTWKQKWTKTLEWNFDSPDVKWFINGKFNITENAIDRHLAKKANQTAFIWEPNAVDGTHRVITYQNLHDEVCKVANTLKSFGIQKGDRVCIYMPMIPETVFAMLACARIGAVHSVVFAGFSSSALAGRIQDSDCKVVLTSDGAYRGVKDIPIKSVVDEALEICPCVEKVLVYKHTGTAINLTERDVIWQDVVPNASSTCAAELMDAEDKLFILYTSGSTGKPKGVVHTCGGYMVYTCYTFQNVFQMNLSVSSPLEGEKPKAEGDLFWCTADVGWITGHSYIAYGPLLAGASSVIFEGVPTFPDAGRFWQVIDKYKVTHFYTAPTAIRALEAAGLEFVKPYKLDSLKVLGSVGEPINEEAWNWYNKNIGKERCPIVNTWWQTETGGILISSLAGVTPSKPSFATLPMPGIQPLLVDEKGNEILGNSVEGNLCIKFPWPSMIRTTYGDHNRCKKEYFSTYPGLYFTGDGCRRDENGFYRITGRVDDVMNISGHRIGTAEVESAINMHADVVESAVVGYPHDIKGQGIYAYVIVPSTTKNHDNLRKEIIAEVNKIIGPIAKPDKIQIVSGLPKTRSGKIMRRILRKVAEGDVSNLGDTSTLLDPSVVDEIVKRKIIADIVRRPIYTSDLISKPEIKKILDEFIVYPITKDKPSLLVDKNIKYDNTLLGNAVEILFEILANGNSRINSPALKSYKKIFTITASKYKKHKNSDDYYLIPTNSNGSFSSGIILKESLEEYCKILYINPENLVKVKTLFHDFNNSLNILKDKNCFIKDLDNSLFAILIIANVLPLCKRFNFFNINYKRINENTITCLKKILENFPKDYINIKEKVISEQQISIAGTVGRLDFIIGNALIEIKSTQQYLTQGHLRQVALYYLGLEEIKKIEIDKISIFYSLYGKMVSYKTEEVFRLDQKDNVLEKLNNLWKPQTI